MCLSCSCDIDWDMTPGVTYSDYPEKYEPLATSKRKRCSSCNELINIGDLAAKIRRFHIPADDIELKIYGEEGEVVMANKWLCERCADICFSLLELKFCFNTESNMMELLDEYHRHYGKQK